jgi:hypothetical protein
MGQDVDATTWCMNAWIDAPCARVRCMPCTHHNPTPSQAEPCLAHASTAADATHHTSLSVRPSPVTRTPSLCLRHALTPLYTQWVGEHGILHPLQTRASCEGSALWWLACAPCAMRCMPCTHHKPTLSQAWRHKPSRAQQQMLLNTCTLTLPAMLHDFIIDASPLAAACP